jgi:hypothetical protein
MQDLDKEDARDRRICFTIESLQRSKWVFMNESKWPIIDLPKITDVRGNLTVIESNQLIPFAIERVYYIYDIPGGESRGGHAHKQQQEFIIAASGSFDAILDNGMLSQRYHLNRGYYGLYVPQLIWRELDNFSTGSICLVLASGHFDEADYLRDYNDFLEAVKS